MALSQKVLEDFYFSKNKTVFQISILSRKFELNNLFKMFAQDRELESSSTFWLKATFKQYEVLLHYITIKLIDFEYLIGKTVSFS